MTVALVGDAVLRPMDERPLRRENSMQIRINRFVLTVALCVYPIAALHAQFDFRVAGRDVQVHSFFSQGYAYSNENNYLTMKTSQGSFAMTDFGANISTQLTDKLRVGAQLYDHNMGNLGKWEPQLDWAMADYRFKDWLGLRGGKVKTVLGLHNDTRDLEFLDTFALLPQSIYSVDLRDGYIAHTGGDVYGRVPLKHLGSLSYTVWAGHRQDSTNGGYIYLLRDRGINYTSYHGLQYGADLRWNLPLTGLVVGISRMNQDTQGTGTAVCTASTPINCNTFNPNGGAGVSAPAEEHSRKDFTDQFYGEYAAGRLKIDTEYRRYFRNVIAWNNLLDVWSDTKSWYVSGSYRLSKWFEVGSYYSHLSTLYKRGPLAASLDASLPANHINDKVIAARFDLRRYWDLKIEGHFMDGYNNNQYPAGFYIPDNPLGLKPKTNLLVIRTGWNF